MAYKPIDNKRDQFRKYLEASGVVEVLTKSITKLMESSEKPESPVDFIRDNMGLSQKELNKIEFLKEEVEAYKKQVTDLKKEIAGLKLERQDVENALAKADIDVAVKVETVPSDTQNDKEIDGEPKKADDADPTQVLENGKPDDDVQKVDIANDVKPDANPAEVEVKVEQKQDDIKTEEKSVVESASETTDK